MVGRDTEEMYFPLAGLRLGEPTPRRGESYCQSSVVRRPEPMQDNFIATDNDSTEGYE